MEIVRKIAQSSCENSDIDTCTGKKPSELEYADYVLLGKVQSKLHVVCDSLKDSVAVLGTRFAN